MPHFDAVFPGCFSAAYANDVVPLLHQAHTISLKSQRPPSSHGVQAARVVHTGGTHGTRLSVTHAESLPPT